MNPRSRALSTRRRATRLAVAVLVGGGPTTAAAPDGGSAVSAEALRRHTFFLGDDAQQGRAPGTPGADAAARYIAGELRRAGLSPLGRHGEWFQDVPLHGTMPGEGTELLITSDCGEGRWRLGEDYLLSTGGVQTRIPRDVPLVFAGYGIVAPEFDYNDYADLDVAGKIVVYLDGEAVVTGGIMEVPGPAHAKVIGRQSGGGRPSTPVEVDVGVIAEAVGLGKRRVEIGAIAGVEPLVAQAEDQ